MNKLSAIWVTKLVGVFKSKEVLKVDRKFNPSQKAREGSNRNYVKGEETMVLYHELQSKNESMYWRHP
jgi:hypothetical protein